MGSSLKINLRKEQFLNQGVASYSVSLLLAVVCLFPILPIFSIVLVTILLIFREDLKTQRTYSLIWMLSLYLGMVNSTKLLPGGDLWNYYNWFNQAEGSSFFDYILWANKEPLFWIYNFIVFRITNGNFEFLVFTLSTFSYLFLFFAFNSYCEALDFGKDRLILGLFILAFFPQLFSLSAHIIRQFLATSMLLYYLVQKLLYGRNYWCILICAVFVHTTTLFFVPIIFYKGFSRQLNLKGIIVGGLIISILVLNLHHIVGFVLNNLGVSFLTNVFLRLSQESFYPLDPLPTLSYVLVLGIVVLSLLNLYKVKTYVFQNNGLIHFLNLVIIVSAFVIATNDLTEISVRFSFYLYAFFPFIIILLPLRSNMLRKGLYLIFGVFILLFWVFRLNYGVFEYAPTAILLINPFLSFLQ